MPRELARQSKAIYCAPVAGKSTLNRLELSREIATRYHKIAHESASIERLFVTHPPKEIVIDLDATDDPPQSLDWPRQRRRPTLQRGRCRSSSRSRTSGSR